MRHPELKQFIGYQVRDPNVGSRAADELEAAVANLIVEIERLVRERNDYQARVIPAETEVVRLEAVIADMNAEESGWRDIVSAPRSGPAFLVWCPERRNVYLVIHHNKCLQHFAPGGDPLRERATHWMPLPEKDGPL